MTETPTTPWRKEDFLGALPANTYAAAAEILDWAEAHPELTLSPQRRQEEVWTGFHLDLTPEGQPLTLSKVDVSGYVQFYPDYPGYVLHAPPFDRRSLRAELTQRLERIDITMRLADYKGKGKKIDLAHLQYDGTTVAFCAVLSWVVGEVSVFYAERG